MYLLDGDPVVSATDLTGFAACLHLTHLELDAVQGRRERPTRADPMLDLLVAYGGEHESARLERYRSEGREVREIPATDRTAAALHAAEQETVAAMHAGADVIYQATFFDGTWRGQADFLLRRDDRPSRLGGYAYDVADTKLARKVKVAALLQMASYAEHLERIQGVPPQRLTVIAGDGTEHAYPLRHCSAYFGRLKARFLQALDDLRDTYPDPVSHCDVCRWLDVCIAQRRADDHLSLVAGIRRDQIRKLTQVRLPRVVDLASAPTANPTSIGTPTYDRLRQQARLQVQERTDRAPHYELLHPEPGLGLAQLPPPSEGDLFLDLEGHPFLDDGGREYLFGVCDSAGGFTALWAHDAAEERGVFESFVDRVMAARAVHPDMHVYHYASYERSALQRLMGRHGTREAEVDELLRGQVLVDLYRVVRQGVRVSRESYSIKDLEVFYSPRARETSAITSGGSSVVAYDEWLGSREPKLLDDIEHYNRLDCLSTLGLRDWLEDRRTELVDRGTDVSRPDVATAEPPEQVAETARETQELVAALLARVPEDPARRDDAQAATWLLAQLLDWHRRESKPEWWEFFERQKLSDEELVEDPAAIGGLGSPDSVDSVRQSTVWRYAFPPQDTKIGLGDKPLDPRTLKGVGTVVGIDADVKGYVDVLRGSRRAPAEPRSLVPAKPLPTHVVRGALHRLGADVAGRGIDADGRYRAARDLLLRRPPRLVNGGAGQRLVGPHEAPSTAVTRLGRGLLDGCLAVQGPPGSGKTWAAARLVVQLVRDGQRVGICAFSHKAIGNLLCEVADVAAEEGLPLRALQKAEGEQFCGREGVDCTTSNEDVERMLPTLNVAAGTIWLFSDVRFDEAFDTLVIDEASQMSLANALAVSTAAKRLVLFGDPRQLAQPGKGSHPPGADVSSLEHLLGAAETMPPEVGVFLDTTWRMHPEVCGYVSEQFYDEQLASHPSCATQQVGGQGALSGAGLRWAPVPHLANRTWSAEEVEVVAGLHRELVGRPWTDARGTTRSLDVEDLLVVAPYNAQVAKLKQALPDGARVGTVDKFQGQEAPVVLYSLATSTVEDLPRSLEFLYSPNRLNVAVSRARGMTVLVGSPLLLDARCHTPEQLRMVNSLCRYVQLADEVTLPSLPAG